MGILNKVKKITGRLFLKREGETARHRKGSNFNDAQSVALLYEDIDEDHFKRVKSFVKYLHTEHGIRKVMAYSFVDTEKKNVPHWHTHKLEFDFFTREDLNWALKPSQHVKSFTEQEFDILIDASNHDCVPLGYVLAQSKARMKVGWQGGAGARHYDLLMSMESFDFEKYLEQVNLYLSNINLK